MNTGASWPGPGRVPSTRDAVEAAPRGDGRFRSSYFHGASTWRAGCGESRTSGSEGGPEKPIVRKATGRSGPTLHLRPDRSGVRVSVYLRQTTTPTTRRGARRVQPPRGGLGDGQSPAHREQLPLASQARSVVAALDMALGQRRPASVIHHSDQGCQYTSLAFGERCRQAGAVPSMGSVGDCYDNAMAESFFASLECELLDRVHFDDHRHAQREIFSYIEGWHNPHRRHQGLGYQSPIDFERSYPDAA